MLASVTSNPTTVVITALNQTAPTPRRRTHEFDRFEALTGHYWLCLLGRANVSAQPRGSTTDI